MLDCRSVKEKRFLPSLKRINMFAPERWFGRKRSRVFCLYKSCKIVCQLLQMFVSPPLQPSLATRRDPAGLPVAPRVALADLGRDFQSPIFSPNRPEKCKKNKLKLDKMDNPQNHQKFQVPKMEVLYLIRLLWG